MGFFDRFRGKKGSEAAAPPAGAEVEAEPEEVPPDAVAVVREGLSTPNDDEMRALLARLAPETTDLPRRGFSQPRWWKQSDWLGSGLRGVASALANELKIDPDKTTWTVASDERGAKIAIVFLYR